MVICESYVVTPVSIVPTPRGVSSPAPMILSPVDIISRVGRTGISIMLILSGVIVSSLEVTWLSLVLVRI
jgi:hypothetical protein